MDDSGRLVGNMNAGLMTNNNNNGGMGASAMNSNNMNGDACRIVLASVTNIMYPVELELMKFLFSKFGTVEKIVTFSRNPTMHQALVQFQYADQAKLAMQQLNNRNIYDGCNTLQIQPSRLNELVVKTNTPKSWDYTLPNQSSSQSISGSGPGGGGGGGGYGNATGVGLLNIPGNSMPLGGHGQYGGGGGGGSMGGGMGGGMGGMGVAGMGMQYNNNMRSNNNILSMMDKLPKELRDLNLETVNPQNTPVLICYNLSTNDITVQKLFNLFSLYGTVMRIKILREKSDTALIQFSEPLYASIAHSLLNNAPLNGRELQISFSKNQEVKMPPQSSQESEEDVKRTKSFPLKDQRYGGGDVEKYVKGACRPTSTLFIANIHEETTENDLTKLFMEYGQIVKFQFKPPREGSRTQMAVVQLQSDVEAILALMNLHNISLNTRFIKVAFSKTVLQ